MSEDDLSGHWSLTRVPAEFLEELLGALNAPASQNAALRRAAARASDELDVGGAARAHFDRLTGHDLPLDERLARFRALTGAERLHPGGYFDRPPAGDSRESS